MADDVFREVDEEIRREQLKKLWDRYQYLVYVAVFLVVFGVGGWRIYEWWETRRAGEVGTQFETAINLSEGGKHDEAAKAFARIAEDGTSGYRGLARLREAAEVAHADRAAALKLYRGIADNTGIDTILRDLAGLRAAAILIDDGDYDGARKLIEPQSETGKVFRHTARELLALAGWRSGDMAAVRRWYAMMATDPETPAAARSRVEILLAVGAAPESKS